MTNDEISEFFPRNDAELHFAKTAASSLATRLVKIQADILNHVPNQWVPEEIRVALCHLRDLDLTLVHQTINNIRQPCKIPSPYLPLLRLAIEEQLETTVLMKEKTDQLTHLEEPQLALHTQLEAGHAVLSLTLFDEVKSPPNYSLSSYLNLETITRIQGANASLEPRVFDDKFHILMSQSLFLRDLRYFRTQCRFRNRPVSVGYIDIDSFGKFNRNLPGKETQVDKDILPRFMSALEGFVFGRGFAYREGGDEYLVLLPGATYSEAAYFFDSLREHLKEVSYPFDISGPTVSIGVCTADASEHLTALQIQQFANKAKAFAKDEGRDRVAGYEEGKPATDKTLKIFHKSAADASQL